MIVMGNNLDGNIYDLISYGNSFSLRTAMSENPVVYVRHDFVVRTTLSSVHNECYTRTFAFSVIDNSLTLLICVCIIYQFTVQSGNGRKQWLIICE